MTDDELRDRLHRQRVWLVWIVIAVAVLLLLSSQAFALDLKTVRQNYHPGLPNPVNLLAINPLPTYGLGVPWCVFTATAIFTATRRREPRLGEAYQIVGNCALPILGGVIVRAVWRPEWDDLPLPPPWVKDLSIRSQQ